MSNNINGIIWSIVAALVFCGVGIGIGFGIWGTETSRLAKTNLKIEIIIFDDNTAL